MAIGDIGSTLDTMNLDLDGNNVRLIRIAGSIVAAVYQGTDDDGFVQTFSVAADGTLATIDTLEFDTTWCQFCDIAHVYGSIYVIVYKGGAGDDLLAATVDINSSGNIANSVVGTGTVTTTSPSHRIRIIKVGHASIGGVMSGVFAVAHDENSVGKVSTFSVTNAGVISSVIETLQYAAVGKYNSICHVAGDVYAIAYTDTDDDGWVCTVTITNAGDIGGAVVDEEEFETDTCLLPDIIPATDGFFLIAYGGVDVDGFVVTVGIDSAGAIDATVTDILEFDTEQCGTPSLVQISGTQYAVAYTGPDADGFIKTFDVDSLGAIGSVTDVLEFYTSNAVNCHVVLGRSATSIGGIYVIGFGQGGASGNAIVATVGITAPNIFPVDAITRVTNIIHRYNRAKQTYTMECSLGDVTSDFGLPQWLEEPRVAIVDEADKPVTRKDIKPEPIPFVTEPRLVPPAIPRTGIVSPGPEPEPVAPEPVRPITVPTTPGIVLPEDVARKVFPGLEIPTEPPTLGGILGATIRAVIPSPIRQAWRAITPWKEEKGETFGGVIGKFFGGLFGGK